MLLCDRHRAEKWTWQSKGSGDQHVVAARGGGKQSDGRALSFDAAQKLTWEHDGSLETTLRALRGTCGIVVPGERMLDALDTDEETWWREADVRHAGGKDPRSGRRTSETKDQPYGGKALCVGGPSQNP